MVRTGGKRILICALAVGPFPKLELTTLVVLVKVPGVVPPVTVTPGNVQVPLPGIVAPVSVMVVAVAENVPPQTDVAAMGVNETPGGVSVIPTFVTATVLGLLMEMVSVEVPPTPITDGVKDLPGTGGGTMVIGAVAGEPTVGALELTVLVILVKVPVVVPPVTVTLGNVQVPPPAIVAPVSVMVVEVAENVPPQADVAAMGVSVTPGGVSVKPTPVRVVVGLGLLITKVNVEVPPIPIVDGVKDLVVAGGTTAVATVKMALAVFPVPWSEVTRLVVLV